MMNDTWLSFTPYAWAKIKYLLNKEDNEVGKYGISSIAEPFLVTDVHVPKQEVSLASVDFDDDGIADMFEQLVEEGLQPAEFARIWIQILYSYVGKIC